MTETENLTTATATEETGFDLDDGFIAIRKQSRTAHDGSALTANSSWREKRKFIRDEAKHSERVKILQQDAGLKESNLNNSFSHQSNIIVPESNAGSFSRLGHVGAYIVRPLDVKQADEAKDILKDDYFIIPNIRLDLPVTIKTDIKGFRRQATAATIYPESAGIRLAHDKNIKGERVHIMVLDSGCDADHVQFRGKHINYRYIVPTAPRKYRQVRGFDPDGHGTHVCGIIAGKDVGIAPDANLYVASVIESESVETSLRRIISALEWLTSEIVNDENSEGAVILNMSLGFKPIWTSSGGASIQIQAVRSVMQTLLEDFDILPVVASGNDGANNLRAPGYFPEVLSVGAVDYNNQQASFTSTGAIDPDGIGQIRQVPDVWGYGVNIYSSFERNSENRSIYAEKSGTSMATPYTTGVAALYAQHTGLIGNELRQHILQNTDANGVVKFVE